MNDANFAQVRCQWTNENRASIGFPLKHSIQKLSNIFIKAK